MAFFNLLNSFSAVNRKVKNSNRSYDVFDEDDSFWDDYNKLDPAYRNQLDPYLKYNYQLGAWDKFGNWLGFNTGEDKYRMEMQDRARLALAGLQNDSFQNTYNSQDAQADRMRDAGLNPDLSGSAEGDPAASLEQPLQTLDPSIFEPPTELLTDIPALFSSAVSGLQGVGLFVKTLGDLRKLKADTTDVQLGNAKSALEYAGQYLSNFDPKTRLDFGDVEVTEDTFNKKAPAAIIEAASNDHPGFNSDSNALFKKALSAKLNDPGVMYDFYQKYNKATEAKIQKIANDKTYGSALQMAEDIIYDQNKLMIDYLSHTQKYTAAYNSLITDYNIQKCKNDFDYEAWKYEHNVPAEIGQSELNFYLRSKAEHDANKAKYEYQKKALDIVKERMDTGDPFAQYLYYSWLNPNGMIPYMSQSGRIGPFSGSWQMLPGFGMDANPLSTLGKGIGSGIAPGSQPYGPGNYYGDMPSK